MTRTSVLVMGLVVANGAIAQLYKPVDQIKVFKGGAELSTPWLGGFNNPMFSAIDLDNDGIKDLVVFEASDGSVHTFRNTGTSNSISYVYTPEFVSRFPYTPVHPLQQYPVLNNWMFLVDYNCDGLEDLISYASAGAQAYRASRDASGQLEFHFETPRIDYMQGSFKVNIYMSPIDYGAFADVNGDGDMDILTFDLSSNEISFYENLSADNGYGCDSLIFKRSCACWGFVSEDSYEFIINLGHSCPCLTGDPLPDRAGPRHSGGSGMLAFDQDDDGDIDLILSDIGYGNLIYLHNGKQVKDSMEWQDANFPSYDVPVNVPVFPSLSMLDVNNDGLEDLVLAPLNKNYCRLFVDTSVNQNGVWFYEGIGPAIDKKFQLRQKDFLVGDMIDVGENSHPSFFDYNADGLLDIVAGTCFRYDENKQLNWGLTLYENTGTGENPEFSFVTDDYMGLSAMEVIGLHPTFGDVDDDGDMDMVCGTADGRLMYFENTAGSGNPANFVYSHIISDGPYSGTNTAPQLVDINRDGLMDIIVGDYNGRILYYENQGSSGSPLFKRVTSNLGGVDVRDWSHIGESYSTPQLAPDGAGNSYRLYVGTATGKVYLYDNIDGNLSGTFNLVTNAVADTFFGARMSPAFADINGDGKLEMLLGVKRGGLIMTSSEWPVDVSRLSASSTSLFAFPIPADESVTFRLGLRQANPWRIELSDLSGRVVAAHEAAGTETLLDVSLLAPGIYLASALGADFRATVKVIVAR